MGYGRLVRVSCWEGDLAGCWAVCLGFMVVGGEKEGKTGAR